MKKAFCILLLLHQNATLGEELSDQAPYILGQIDDEATNQLTIVTIRLDRKIKPNDFKMEHFSGYTQISIKNTLAPAPGQFNEGSTKLISKIAAFQMDMNTAAVRLFYKDGIPSVHAYSDIEQLENRLIFTVDTSTLFRQINIASLKKVEPEKAKPKEEAPPIDTPADKVQDEKKAETPPPNKTKESPPPSKEVTIGSAVPDLASKLEIVALFILFMFAVLIAVLSIRRIRRGREHLLTRQPQNIMRTISDLRLTPKQRLTLVQVGHKKLLLAISPEGVHLLQDIDQVNTTTQKPAVVRANATQMPQIKPSARQQPAANKASSRDFSSYIAQPQARNETKKAEKPKATQPKKRINKAVGDEGIKDLSKSNSDGEDTASDKAIDEITRIIRKKLNNLPPID